MSIPKKIHYCWFGKNPLPESVKKCINSWKKFCPDYEIIKWDEDNFDVSDNLYAKQALENKKYAFVSDYARHIFCFPKLVLHKGCQIHQNYPRPIL